jgi:D-alanyl-D-alanine carboxypeptidase
MRGAQLEMLGISQADIALRGLSVHQEATDLVVADTDQSGREYLLTPAASTAWHTMKLAAERDNILLCLASAFRSIQRQSEIIQGKLALGNDIQTILQVCAPPGYSEHHTGRAIDIVCAEHPDLEISFETTAAFRWLQTCAKSFGFYMSYPRDNACGFQYEPWHWCFADLSTSLNSETTTNMKSAQ